MTIDILRPRFWSRVRRGDPTECWEWTAGRGSDGYGQIRLHGVRWKAHRLSWELHHGPIPDGLHVLHRCDNPRCVNPVHLWLGTDADNASDKAAKGRSTRGERNRWARITATQVREIRAYDGPLSQQRLGELYGISQAQIWKIRHGRAWLHLEGE